MQPALFDTSIYISALRRGSDAALALRRVASDAPLWLSSVVLEELYAGAGDRERRVVERLERDFDRVKRMPFRAWPAGWPSGRKCSTIRSRRSRVRGRSGRAMRFASSYPWVGAPRRQGADRRLAG